jgi:hypothetical protein
MGTCPFCRAQTLPGDSICFSCGRVISGASGMDSRVKGEFMRGTTRNAKQGVAPRHAMQSAKPKRGGKRKKSRINQLGLLALIAFIFFTPDARQFVLAKWAEVEDWLEDAIAPVQEFPLETEYTVLRSIDLWNNGSGIGHLEESIPLPVDVSSNEKAGVALAFTDGTEVPKTTIQKILGIELRIDGDKILIPPDGTPERSKNNAIETSDGNLVWWPGQGSGSDKCGHGPCVRISMDVPSGTHEAVDLAVTIHATSFTWWHSTIVDGKIEGKSEGTSLSRSGTFDNIAERGNGVRDLEFASTLNWYDRNQGSNPSNWAIDARQSTAPTIYQTAASIEANLPSHLKENVYAFSRATFDWLNDNVPYDYNAPNMARSGEQCLEAGLGDCDEQSNAFMSIMRVKGVPTWYVFGALTDSSYSTWQGHAWSYIMIPMSDEWCEDHDVVLSTCFVEGSVDVVNHKWLVHTPTAYIDWIEKSPWSLVDEYYSGSPISGQDFTRARSFSTESYDTMGGTWDHKWLSEDLS